MPERKTIVPTKTISLLQIAILYYIIYGLCYTPCCHIVIPQTYTGEDLPACKYHPGVPIFHEGYVNTTDLICTV